MTIAFLAMNQKELDRLIENSCREVYLFEKSFIIPGTISNMIIIGINNPTLEIDSDEMIDFKSRKVIVSGVIFGNRYQKIIDDYKYEIEHRNNKKHQCYRASNIFDVRLSDQDRNESKKLFDYLENELTQLKNLQISLKLILPQIENYFDVAYENKTILLNLSETDFSSDKKNSTFIEFSNKIKKQRDLFIEENGRIKDKLFEVSNEITGYQKTIKDLEANIRQFPTPSRPPMWTACWIRLLPLPTLPPPSSPSCSSCWPSCSASLSIATSSSLPLPTPW